MSEKPDSGKGSGGHSEHDHEVFDAQPATELSPGEPETPLWVPVVGLTFFVLVGIWWSLGDDEETTGAAPTATASAVAKAPPARVPDRARAPIRPPSRPGAPPAGTARPTVKGRLNPEQIEMLKKRIEAQRKEGATP
jgi:hypothetical protein